MAEKVTMVLKVDLQCPCCYKKVKKILCKFPQIRDQVYDEKANTVTITVVSCNPEKIRDKLCCKGCKVIQSIEIVKPKPKPKPPPAEPPKPPPPKPPPPVEPPKPPPPAEPVRTCCRPCYEGYGGGPCYHGYGVPLPPQPCYDGFYGYGYGYDYCRGCHARRCVCGCTEETPQTCSIM